MPELTPNKSTVTLIAKNPIAYMLAVAFILLGFFVDRTFKTDDSKNADCKEQVKSERMGRQRAEQKADESQKQLVDILLAENERRAIESRYRDSVVRSTIGNKAKTIIKNSKK